MENIQANKTPFKIIFKNILFTILNPAGIVNNRFEKISWVWSLLVSGITFGLFFLQSGLDLAHYDQAGVFKIIFITFKGILMGTLGVFIIAMTARALAGIFGTAWDIPRTASAFALSYSTTLLYVFLGFLANIIFGWNTAIAFGITGLIWALGPIFGCIKEMVHGKTGASIFICSFCGLLALAGWYYLV